MIYTREQLIHEIEKIIDAHITVDYEDKHARAAAEEIVDLISTLNDEDAEAWKNIP